MIPYSPDTHAPPNKICMYMPQKKDEALSFIGESHFQKYILCGDSITENILSKDSIFPNDSEASRIAYIIL